MADGYLPNPGDHFETLTCASAQGSFCCINGCYLLGHDLRFEILTGNTNLTLLTIAAPDPERPPLDHFADFGALEPFVFLCWPTEFEGFALQSSITLSPPNWTHLGTNHWNPALAWRPQEYFQLKKPSSQPENRIGPPNTPNTRNFGLAGLELELLSAHAGLVHEPAACDGEDGDAELVFRVGGCAGGGRHCAGLGAEGKLAFLEAIEGLGGLEEDDFGIHLASELKTDRDLRQGRFADEVALLKHLPLAMRAANPQPALPHAGKHGEASR